MLKKDGVLEMARQCTPKLLQSQDSRSFNKTLAHGGYMAALYDQIFGAVVNWIYQPLSVLNMSPNHKITG